MKTECSGVKQSGWLIIAASVFLGLLYAFLDTHIDDIFKYDNEMREIYEKSAVALLFILFAVVFLFLFKRIRYYQEILENKERKYREYMLLAPDPIIITDKNGKIIETNPAAEEALGFSQSELRGSNLTEFSDETGIKDACRFFIELAQTAKAVSVLRFHKSDGVRIYMHTGAAKIDDNTYVCICRDITDFMDMSFQMKRLNSELQSRVDDELHKLRRQEYVIENNKKFADMGHMLTAISHQWRQPLNSLGLYIQDMVDTYADGELTEGYISEFDSTSKGLIAQMSSIIDDFRVFFSPDGTDKEFNIVREIMDLMQILSAQIYYMGVDVRFRCGCEKQNFDCKNVFTCPDCVFNYSYVKGNVGKFRQAVLNIIYNSLEAVQERKLREPGFRGEVAIGIKCHGKILIEIEDNGGGFSEEALAKAFEPYYSGKKDGGTGLGLFTVKMVIEEHMKGKVSLMNTDKGANVAIELIKCRDGENQESSTLSM